MDIATINRIAFVACLIGLGVGIWMLRWSRRELALLANERQTVLKRRLGLWGRRAHARAFMVGAIAILYFSLAGIFTLLTRQ